MVIAKKSLQKDQKAANLPEFNSPCSIIRPMTALTISPTLRKSLKADAHDLKPVVMVGGDGLTPAVIKEARHAISHHQLIKVRVFGDDRDERIAIYEALCDQLNAAPVQHIGKLLVLWKPKENIEDTSSHLGRSSKQSKKSMQTPSSKKSVQRSANSKSPFARAAAVKTAIGKKRILRANATESKIGWTSPGYKKATATPSPIKKRKVRMSSTKKKSLGS